MRLSFRFTLLVCTAILLHPLAVRAEGEALLPEQVSTTDQQVGSGRQIQTGMFAVLHYAGWVYDPAAADKKGVRFVDSRARGATLSYVYGYGRAVRGLERGLQGMKVGGRRTIVIPAKLGYDGFKHPYPAEVPKGSALVFEVELLDVVPQGAPPDE
jgi:FKBP-type peptidyl-prolyl cis-trans isomerase FkpA